MDVAADVDVDTRQDFDTDGQRRFEAIYDCHTKEHWKHVTDYPVNYEMSGDLHILRSRCEYEFQNNPMVAGVIETHTIDLLGESGPTLQVQSDSDRYNRLLEEIWEVSIHASVKDATVSMTPATIGLFCFNPRVREGRDPDDKQQRLGPLVSIHASVKDATTFI